jgi:preprotein translocase subunit YajC
MFSSSANAAGGASSGMASLVSFTPLLLIFIIMYVLILRPQQQAVKRLRSKIDAVKKGDEVVTGGGHIGKVTKVEEGEVELEIASGVRIRVLKSLLSDVRAHGTKPAND